MEATYTQAWRKPDQECKHYKQAATCDAYRATNQLRMAARRALEWIGMFKGPAVILDMKYQTFFFRKIVYFLIAILQ